MCYHGYPIKNTTFKNKKIFYFYLAGHPKSISAYLSIKSIIKKSFNK